MRAFRAGFIAFAFASAFTAGCSQGGSAALAPVDTDPKAVEAMVAKLTTESFKGKATGPADIAAVRDALPKEVSLTWGSLSFDQASGATVLTGVKLTPAEMTSVGINIDELRLFDFDASFAKARLQGQRLTEAAPLARRIDAKGVSLFGLADLLNGMVGGSNEVAVAIEEPATDQPVDGAAPAAPPAADNWPAATEPQLFDDSTWDKVSYGPSFERYDFGYGRIVLDDVVLRPFELVPVKAAADDPFAEMMAVLQPLAAVSRSFGVDSVALLDMKGSFAMTEMGRKISGSLGVKSMGIRGWRGGDIDAAYVRDASFLMNGGDNPTDSVQGGIGLYTLEDMRLDKLYGALAKGAMPARTEADLMSIGLLRMENETIQIGGKEVYAVGESTLDARKFHWFIPTDLKASAKNVTVDIGNFVSLMEQAAGAYGGITGPGSDYIDGAPDTRAILAALEKYGLSKPVMNFNVGWNWNAASGDTRIDIGFGAEKFMQIDAKYEGGFPSFKAVSDLIPDNVEEANGMALSNLFDAKSTLKVVDVNLTDKGGLNAIFGIASEVAPEMMGGLAMGADGQGGKVTPETMRTLIATFLRAMAEQAAPQMPEMASIINPFASFIAEGGKLHYVMQPPKPLPFSQLAGIDAAGMSPAQMLKALGLKVEHSK